MIVFNHFSFLFVHQFNDVYTEKPVPQFMATVKGLLRNPIYHPIVMTVGDRSNYFTPKSILTYHTNFLCSLQSDSRLRGMYKSTYDDMIM